MYNYILYNYLHICIPEPALLTHICIPEPALLTQGQVRMLQPADLHTHTHTHTLRTISVGHTHQPPQPLDCHSPTASAPMVRRALPSATLS